MNMFKNILAVTEPEGLSVSPQNSTAEPFPKPIQSYSLF